jgi:integrase
VPRPRKLPEVRELKNKSHFLRKRGYRYVVDFRNAEGKRIRILYRHGQKEEADAEVEKQLTRITNLGTSTASILTDATQREAAECIRRLRERGKTLTEATEYLLDYLKAGERSWPVSKLMEQVCHSKKREEKSARYLRDLEGRLKRFEEDFGYRPADSITSEEISDWLADLDLSPISRNNYRRVLAVAFAFGIKRKACRSNPARDAEKAKEIEGEVSILTPTQAAKLLEKTGDTLLPAVAIGLFAGLRTSEILRLDWSEIDFGEKHILVKAEKAKSARRRYVTIPDNLRSWLLPLAKKRGPIAPLEGEFYRELTNSRREAGLLDGWQGNEMRHSFASFHLAKHTDAGKTAAELGHASTALVFSHYRKLAKPAAAARYFGIVPQPEAEGKTTDIARGRKSA